MEAEACGGDASDPQAGRWCPGREHPARPGDRREETSAAASKSAEKTGEEE